MFGDFIASCFFSIHVAHSVSHDISALFFPCYLCPENPAYLLDLQLLIKSIRVRYIHSIQKILLNRIPQFWLNYFFLTLP